MIRFVYGMAGSGKSHYTASEITGDLLHNKNALLIVPEQQTVEAEERFADIAEAGSIPTLGLEVLNFTRLANRVFRRFGGLAYNYIGRGARQLIMWRTLAALSPLLSEYKNISLTDKNVLRLMLDTVSEFRRYNITPVMLEDAADTLEKEKAANSLKKKLRDLSLIYSMYQKLLHDKYDDPEEDLTRLSKILDKNNFFQGYNVYIDSFTGFTPQQFSVLRHIIRQADNVTVTLGMLPGSAFIMLDGLKKTESALKQIVADEHKTAADGLLLHDSPRFSSLELKLLESYLWDYEKTDSVFSDITQHISLIECSDIFCEAEAAAKDILRRIRQGGHFYDNVVVMRDAKVYLGVIDAVFEKYGIPYFMSVRTDLKMKPPVKLILSALSVISCNWRCDDIISYIKTGYSSITSDECDLFETYVSTWNIEGRRFTDEGAWNMNPDGYTDVLTERGRMILGAVNIIRQKLTVPLIALRDSFGTDCTVRSASEAIFLFLCELNIREKSASLGEDEPAQLWNIIIDTLDQLVIVAPDANVNAEQYMRLVSIMFDEADIGRIPTSIDEVTIGSAMTFRAGRAKNIYILGANEGKFPQSVADDGIFNDNDRITLETLGIILSPESDLRTSDELLYFYRAATCVDDNITVIYSSADLAGHALRPSPACDRLRILFPRIKTECYSDMRPLDLIEGREASFEYTAMYRGTPAGDALREIYSRDTQFKRRLEALDEPFVQPSNSVSSGTAKELFGGDLQLTQSKFESYAMCGFSYYCRYVLRLTERKRAEFKSVDVGNFIHHILECFMTSVKTDNGIRTDLTDTEIELISDKIINEYIGSVIHNTADRSNRILQLFRRLKRTSMLLIRNLLDEFGQSNFVPSFFELPIRFGDGEAAEPFSVPLPDNTNAYVFGKVDRVDTYKKGNDVYIRVVDYKTGVKDFSLSDIELGLNLQMLLYLFALWLNPSDTFKEKAGCEKNGKILPAGVLYFSASAPELSLEKEENKDTVTSKANSALTRKGLLIDDKEILGAMEKSFGGNYIPVKLKADGNFTAASPVQTLEGFGSIMRDISDTINKLGKQLKDGRADALPQKKSGHNACEYCPQKPICRIGDFK
jgi:ATP-dependent helicase/nuclease subunit B